MKKLAARIMIILTVLMLTTIAPMTAAMADGSGCDINEHQYSDPKWTWVNKETVSARVTCENCEYDNSFDGVVTYKEIPSCEGTGKRIFIGTINLNEKAYTNEYEITEEIQPIGHVVDTAQTPKWVWTDDYQSAEAVFPCTREDCTGSLGYVATVEHGEPTAATCTTPSVKVHTATYDKHSASAEQILAPMLKHEYVATWNWNDEQQAQVSFKCAVCTDSVVGQAATVTVGETTVAPTCLVAGEVFLSGTITYQEKEYKQLGHRAVVAPLGHTWDTTKAPAWVWTSGYQGATATFPCVHKSDCGGEHQLAATITKSNTKAATCTAAGKETVTATVTLNKNEFSSAIEAELAIIGHTVVIDKAKTASTSRTGLTEGSHCSVCNKVIKAQVVIPKYVLENNKDKTTTSTTSKTCPYGHTVSVWRPVGNRQHRSTCTVAGCGAYVTEFCDLVDLVVGSQTYQVCTVCGQFGETSLPILQGATITAVDSGALPRAGNLVVRYLEIMDGSQKQVLFSISYEDSGVIAPFSGTVKVSIPIILPADLQQNFSLVQVDMSTRQLGKLTKAQQSEWNSLREGQAWTTIPYTYSNSILTFELEAAGLYMLK